MYVFNLLRPINWRWSQSLPKTLIDDVFYGLFGKWPEGATKCLIGIKYWIFNLSINHWKKAVPLISFHREGRRNSLFHDDEPRQDQMRARSRQNNSTTYHRATWARRLPYWTCRSILWPTIRHASIQKQKICPVRIILSKTQLQAYFYSYIFISL